MINIPHNKLNDAVEALQYAGLFVTPDQISQANPERLYRCGTTQKPRGKNGWFKLLHDGSTGFVTICYGNWETNHSDKYHIKPDNDLLNDRPRTLAERQAFKQRIEEQMARDRVRRDAEIATKRIQLVDEYNSFKHCHTHPYLAHKGIQHPQHYQLRIDDRFNANKLAIPFIDSTGQMQGYQTIDIDGAKRFNGRTGGNFWRYPMTNPCTNVFDDSNSFFILCEGMATGLSAYEVIIEYFDTQVYLPIVLCAFNVGNLSKVIDATKAHKLPYLLLVDNDVSKPINAGIETAKTLLNAHHDVVIEPLLLPDGDANDFILAHGETAFIQKLTENCSEVINKILLL